MSKINSARRLLLKFSAATFFMHFPLYNKEAFASNINKLAIGSATSPFFIMPDESSMHTATWMAYGATVRAWGYEKIRFIARKDLMRIAANISRFEPVKMLVANIADRRQAKKLLAKVKKERVIFSGANHLPNIEAGGNIQFIISPLDDLWIRDTGPIFVRDSNNKLAAINFNYNGWGQENTGAFGWQKDAQKAANGIFDKPIAQDKQVADFVLNQTGANKLTTWLVMEGGGIEVNGKGTAICTESCILNPNRNPGRTKAEVEDELWRILGVKKVIWLPGVKAQDITDAHVDFYARFIDEAVVVYHLETNPQSQEYIQTRINQKILSEATDAFGNKITAIAIKSPDLSKVRKAAVSRNGVTVNKYFDEKSFAAGYAGFYLINSAVLITKFGDEVADKAALNLISKLYPERIVIQITTDGIACSGGSIHCTTQQQI